MILSLLYLSVILSYIATGLSFIWFVVEFVLYIIGEEGFNWKSLISLYVSAFVMFTLMIMTAYRKMKHEAEEKEKRETQRRAYEESRPKSMFQQRLEEVQRLQKEARKNRNQ